jgi:hypothetical protein
VLSDLLYLDRLKNQQDRLEDRQSELQGVRKEAEMFRKEVEHLRGKKDFTKLVAHSQDASH